ncbi:MAG: Diaminohydroxyphosphoribosylaminopyrimidine deaminase / 5-amino-6-(5-phosphoribosylamino)uracil reductase, partial [uncultured Quadrisphaera sp.]
PSGPAGCRRCSSRAGPPWPARSCAPGWSTGSWPTWRPRCSAPRRPRWPTRTRPPSPTPCAWTSTTCAGWAPTSACPPRCPTGPPLTPPPP